MILLFLPCLLFAGSWAEETLHKMTLEEKIGQLFMAPACPLADEAHFQRWQELLSQMHIGNAILKQSDAASQVRFLNRLQKASPIPLLIGADAEWGLGMRMSDMPSYPKHGMLGAADDISGIYDIAYRIGQEARRVGVHINFAPVADVNSNPDNPIIGPRSFGSDPKKVAECVALFIRGLQDAGLLAVAKHFPGHGDTSLDSHLGLPRVDHPRTRLDAVELIPFQRAIEEKVFGIMSAHILTSALDPTYPATLSAAVQKTLLRGELGYQGLIISDALNMKALTDHFSYEEIALLARRAGVDLLLYGDHRTDEVRSILQEQIPRAYKALKEAYLEGTLSVQELDESALRILRAKEKMGLSARTAP